MRSHVRFIARAVTIVAVLAAIAGAFYEQLGAWRDGRVLTQTGRSIDVGGRTLNLHCVGDGTPTVVFISGRTAPGYVWTPTQRGVAVFTRACWYDRADIGWSDSGPDPAWGNQAARDLHQLTRNAPLHAPLVLVGHSFGGYIARLYHHRFPGEVSGLVLVDASHEDAGTIPGIPRRERPPIPRTLIRGLSFLLGHLGMMRLLASDSGPPPPAWSAQEWDMLARLRRQRSMLLADAKTGPEEATADQVRSAGGLEDLPLIVLTQGRPLPDSSSAAAAVRRGWVELQRELAGRSRRGQQIVVAESGHGIPIEAPDAVIRAVRDIVMRVRDEGLRRGP